MPLPSILGGFETLKKQFFHIFGVKEQKEKTRKISDFSDFSAKNWRFFPIFCRFFFFQKYNFLFTVCGNHPGGRTLAHRAHTQGYYWPTMKSDAADYVKKCDPCQRMSPILKSLMQDLVPISSPWPFAQWGIDIVGPLPTAPAQKKILLVATDYFSKWIEADAFSSIKDRDVTWFIWKNIVCRFGIPRSIMSDKGPQFDSQVYRDFYRELKIKNLYSTPRYPQSNGQTEASNKTLLTALKKRLDSAKGKWVEELPGMLWAYRTTARNPTGISSFSFTYGMEVVIPTEIGLPTIRTTTPE